MTNRNGSVLLLWDHDWVYCGTSLNNEFGEGTLLNRAHFSTLFPFLYFNLTKQKMDINDGSTKLTFKYDLSGTKATAYSVYCSDHKLKCFVTIKIYVTYNI